MTLRNIMSAGGQQAWTVLSDRPASATPITSSPFLVVAFAVLGGLLVVVALVLIIGRLNGRVRTAGEVERLTRLPVLAELPYDRSAARRRKKERLPAAGRQGELAERLRSLRAGVQARLPEGRGVVVLTSVEPGDGKTFISANMAVSWSRAGRKVILIGGDMRRPELGRYFADVADRRGLSDLLSMHVPGRRSPTQPQIQEALVATPFRGLRVLPPGSETDGAADLLGTSNLPRILRFARRVVDVVVVDSPPVLGLADATELARSADGVLLVVTLRRTRRRLLSAAADTLRANDVTVLGTVVNRSRRRLPRSYAAYYSGTLRPRRSGSETRATVPDEAPPTWSRQQRSWPEPADASRGPAARSDGGSEVVDIIEPAPSGAQGGKGADDTASALTWSRRQRTWPEPVAAPSGAGGEPVGQSGAFEIVGGALSGGDRRLAALAGDEAEER